MYHVMDDRPLSQSIQWSKKKRLNIFYWRLVEEARAHKRSPMKPNVREFARNRVFHVSMKQPSAKP